VRDGGAARLFARSFPPPWEAAGLSGALEACGWIARSVPVYDLAFRPDRSAVTAALQAWRGKAA
jgi:hypothetical protein